MKYFLATYKRWPRMEGRKGRDLKELIRRRIRTEKDSELTEEKCRQLNLLINNFYKDLYPIKSFGQEINKETFRLLSSESQKHGVKVNVSELLLSKISNFFKNFLIKK
jgi:hypothetical protein